MGWLEDAIQILFGESRGLREFREQNPGIEVQEMIAMPTGGAGLGGRAAGTASRVGRAAAGTAGTVGRAASRTGQAARAGLRRSDKAIRAGAERARPVIRDVGRNARAAGDNLTTSVRTQGLNHPLSKAIIAGNAGIIGAAGVDAAIDRLSGGDTRGRGPISLAEPGGARDTKAITAGEIPVDQRGVQATPAPAADPYSEFLGDYYDQIASSYDAQIEAMGGLAPIYKEQAAESQGNIGNFFGYAAGQAQAGIPVTQQVYGDAEGKVNQIYDQLGERLVAMPETLTGVASDAAGGAIGSSVAERVAAASAPFMAAGETARADAVANLTQGSSAGQSYLNNLAAAAPAEGAMHQSSVEQALNQQLQLVAFRQAELEGSKQRALAEISADIAGETSERMANAAMAQALGLQVPGGLDPLDYLRAQGMMQGLQSGELDQQSAILNLTEKQNPDWQFDDAVSNLSSNAQGSLGLVRSIAESSFAEGDDPRNLPLHMLKVLDDMARSAGEGNWSGEGTDFGQFLQGGEIPAAIAAPKSRQKIMDAIRLLMQG